MTDADTALGGYYLVYRGTTHPVLFSGEGWLAVAATEDQREQFPDAVEHGVNSRGSWVKLPVDAVERRFRRTVEATWRDEPVTVVGPVLDGTVLLHYRRSPERAAELGMAGDRQSGWQLRVPLDEVDVVNVSDRDFS
ncbi:hypothetical protein [Nocardioides sp.]|uniref:hypothetical protein n=1 Tax=Nocardioides sp. TaxID=35761 RepID=UPI002ED5F9BF